MSQCLLTQSPYRFLVVIATTTEYSPSIQTRAIVSTAIFKLPYPDENRFHSLFFYIQPRRRWERELISCLFWGIKPWSNLYTWNGLIFLQNYNQTWMWSKICGKFELWTLKRVWRLVVPILVLSDFCVSPLAFFVCPVHLSPSFLLVIGFTVLSLNFPALSRL